jgi:hypothetical protein
LHDRRAVAAVAHERRSFGDDRDAVGDVNDDADTELRQRFNFVESRRRGVEPDRAERAAQHERVAAVDDGAHGLAVESDRIANGSGGGVEQEHPGSPIGDEQGVADRGQAARVGGVGENGPTAERITGGGVGRHAGCAGRNEHGVAVE